jgi:hypothetical protein
VSLRQFFSFGLLLLAIAYLDLISHNHRYDTFSDPIVNIWLNVWAVNFVLPPALAAPGLGGRQQTLGHSALGHASDSSSGGGVKGGP